MARWPLAIDMAVLCFLPMIVTPSIATAQRLTESRAAVVTFLFSDIEGSTRLWEQAPEKMRQALEIHDSIALSCIDRHRGKLVKKTGDGVHAAFDDPLQAVNTMLDMQLQLAEANKASGFALALRCGLHLGTDEQRDGDFYGQHVNRAARVMSVAHGGQMLLSEAVEAQIRARLPDGTSLRDLGTCRLRDLSAPLRLYQLVHPCLRANFPALRSLASTPNNLAQQLNSFVGRERELGEVREQLAASRLVTLLGTGGIGKSRLSMQLGAELLDDFPDGVWFVELAPLIDARLVAQAIASVLGVKEEAGYPVIDALAKHVRDRCMLLILDNCEHVVHAAAEIAKRLLQAGSQLKILTSSREVLRIAGEVAYQVPTLSSPVKGHTIVFDELVRHEAVRLFVDRATAAQPSFRITRGNAEAVTEICQRVDGIPLAIELAAARARALPVETIAERLRDRFKILVTTDQTVLPRQRTLQALIDWSYDYLAKEEQVLFQRLSVFAGGWTLEAAEAVCADEDIDIDDVLDLMTALVEKSLVAMDAEGARYRMLETVREYASDKFESPASAELARERHLSFFVSIAESARQHLQGALQTLWLERIDNELENLIAAQTFGGKNARLRESKSRLVRALRIYWLYRGYYSLGLDLYMDLLLDGSAVPLDERCRTLFGAGQICCFMGRYSEARIHLEEGLSIAIRSNDQPAITPVQTQLGIACRGQGDWEAARQHLESALVGAQARGFKTDICSVLIALTMLHRARGQLNLAEPACINALAVARECDDRELIGRCLLNLAMIYLGAKNTQHAKTSLLEAANIAQHINSQPLQQCALDVAAALCSASSDWARAIQFFTAAEAQRLTLGIHRDPADNAFLIPLIERARDALDATTAAASEAYGNRLTLTEALSSASLLFAAHALR